MALDDLPELQAELMAKIDSCADESALEELRVYALGKKGVISERMKSLGKMSPEERKEAGPLLNGLKDRIATAISARKDILAHAALEARLT